MKSCAQLTEAERDQIYALKHRVAGRGENHKRSYWHSLTVRAATVFIAKKFLHLPPSCRTTTAAVRHGRKWLI